MLDCFSYCFTFCKSAVTVLWVIKKKYKKCPDRGICPWLETKKLTLSLNNKNGTKHKFVIFFIIAEMEAIRQERSLP